VSRSSSWRWVLQNFSEFESRLFFFRNITPEFDHSWSFVQAQILTRIHHKNLVSMIGYCKDGQYMALVYEYMSEGTLQEQIAGMPHTSC
jgi:serine/threonine protein kinase